MITKSTKKRLLSLLAVLYSAFMLYLLVFGRLGNANFSDFGSYIKEHISLIPGRFLYEYIKSVKTDGLLNFQLRNILGNILLFLPLGVITVNRTKNKPSPLSAAILTCAVILMIVELCQLILTIGWLDIDDLLLNCLGVTLGGYLFLYINNHTNPKNK